MTGTTERWRELAAQTSGVSAADLDRLWGELPTVRAAEVRRLMEDKAFDVTRMRERLGVTGRPLAEGLALTFRRA